MDTLEQLKLKADFNTSSDTRMPSLRKVSELLTQYGVAHELTEKTNVVEYKNSGNRYVNSRRMGKKGLCLTVGKLELDTSDSYYSVNTSMYAYELLKLLNK